LDEFEEDMDDDIRNDLRNAFQSENLDHVARTLLGKLIPLLIQTVKSELSSSWLFARFSPVSVFKPEN
jgi:hypothetical protein